MKVHILKKSAMQLIFFFEVSLIATRTARAFSEHGLSLTETSTTAEVEAVVSTSAIDAILVPAVSAETWLYVEAQLRSHITMPRILVNSSPERAVATTTHAVHESGFDGFVHLDRGTPLPLKIKALKNSVLTTTTSGARAPDNFNSLFISPTIEEITLGRDENLEILRLAAIGYTHTEIAKAIHLSSSTTRNRFSQMFLRAGVRNRTELLIAYEQRLARHAIFPSIF